MQASCNQISSALRSDDCDINVCISCVIEQRVSLSLKSFDCSFACDSTLEK